MATVQTGIATDLITFSRTSNATVTDSDGKIKWAPHNLLLASEQFDSASWLKAAATSAVPVVTANAGVAPNGTTTADRVDYGLIDAANDISVVSQIFTAVDTTYRGGVYVKAATGGDVGKKVWMLMYDTAYRGAASVTLTTEWQLLSSTVTLTAGSNRELCIATIGSTNGGENQGAVSVHLWGAHLYRSDLGGMKANTSAYPMYNPTTPKNLLGFTQSFDNAAWAKGSLVTTGMANVTATTDPLGGNTADKLQETATTAEHYILQSISASATPYTFSVYLKAAERTWATLQFLTASIQATWFNLAPDGSGVPGTVAAGFTAASTYVGNGWYRCSITGTTTPGTWYAVVNPSLGNEISPVYAGTLNSGIYLWGAQLSDSASLDTYVPNYGAAPTAAAYYGPRLDFDPVTLAAKGLLVEEARTNTLQNSSAFSSGLWTVDGASLTASAGIGPDGALSATGIVQGTGNNRVYQFDNSNVTGSKVFSLYVKPNAGSSLSISTIGGMTPLSTAVINASTGAVTGFAGASSVAVGNGWYRVFLPVNVVAASSNSTYWVIFGPTSSVFIYGAQLEAGSFATSYIPTGAATATRNADVASVSTQAFPYSASESTIVASASPIGPGGAAAGSAVFSLKGASGNGLLLYQPATTYSLAAYVDASNVALGTSSLGAIEKLAIAYNGVSNGAVRNGGAVSSVGTTVAAVASSFDFGNIQASYVFNGHIRQITYLPRRISNAELQTRTA